MPHPVRCRRLQIGLADVRGVELIRRVRTALQKAQTLFVAMMLHAALHVLTPREFANCCVQVGRRQGRPGRWRRHLHV